MSDLTDRCYKCGVEGEILAAAWAKPSHGVRRTALVCIDSSECTKRCGEKYGEHYGI